MKKDILRRIILRPYIKGMPVFSLTTWDTHRQDSRGCTKIGYAMRMNGKVLFTGDDYSVGMGSCDDDDASVAGLLGFLTLRPGDTDDNYFDSYTKNQLDYCNQHAEALSCEVSARFGEF